jgi:uncharacterized protein (UPF0264 family)
MNNKAIINRFVKADRNKGLLIAIAASLVLILLAVYNVPLIHNELYGEIIGVSEVHNETGSRLIVAVHLDTGEQVLASIPRDLQIRTGVKAKVMEGRSIFGLKSYKVITYNE